MVDIAAAITTNAEKAAASLDNIHFEVVDGIGLPFGDGTFDGVVCRYALHHFPALATTLTEVHRVMKEDSRLVIADALRHDGDDVDFINRFQALQPDGHVRMYDRLALLEACTAQGFVAEDSHLTAISFSRPLDGTNGELLAATAADILVHYGIEVVGEMVQARFEVLNAASDDAIALLDRHGPVVDGWIAQNDLTKLVINFPDNFRMDYAFNVVGKWLEANPEKWHEPQTKCVFFALMQAYGLR